MTVTLPLNPDLEARVRQEARKQELPVEDYLVHLVEAALPAESDEVRRARALAAIDGLMDIGDEQEQRETFEALKMSLDEDRLSDRKLFS